MACWYVGIDPGNTGALAFYDPQSDSLEVHDVPVVSIKVGRAKRNRLDPYQTGLILMRTGIERILLENVHALPKQGVSSTFTFGFSFGALQGAIGALQLRMETVEPGVWKRSLGLSSEKDEARRAASREFPRHAHLWPLKKHHGRAEAALLALLCARKHHRV